MKCLSIQQPWAWAILFAGKDIENRRWGTGHCGPLAIHASRTFDIEGYHWCKKVYPGIHWPYPRSYERGGLVGIVEVDGYLYHGQTDSRWFEGPIGWHLINPVPCEFTPMRGQLGLFEINPNKINLTPAVTGQVTSER
jgi:hypothetical protein